LLCGITTSLQFCHRLAWNLSPIMILGKIV